MSRTKRPKRNKERHVAILLVEGETEEEFYKYLARTKFEHIPKKIVNLKGNFNINKKIIDSAFRYNTQHPQDTFDIYVCIDQEKIGVPAFNRPMVENEIGKIGQFKKLYPVIAILMMESLFFIDIDGIYRFLNARKSLRNRKKYNNFRRLRHQELDNV